MERTTHRQYLVWMAWLEWEWNRLSKLDYHLMQIAAEVRRTAAKKPEKVKLGHLRIRFENPHKAKPMTEEQKKQVAAMAKSRIKAAISGGGQRRRPKIVKQQEGRPSIPPPPPVKPKPSRKKVP